jgi:hypothetical protein
MSADLLSFSLVRAMRLARITLEVAAVIALLAMVICTGFPSYVDIALRAQNFLLLCLLSLLLLNVLWLFWNRRTALFAIGRVFIYFLCSLPFYVIT